MVQRYIIGVLGILVPSPTGSLVTYADYEQDTNALISTITDLESEVNNQEDQITALTATQDALQARMTRLRHEWQTMKNQQRPTK